ncbi:MAG: leucine-rich repeat protein [Firmicutes bacterium]|nr:leucine-rich repeat protein [Bacillota bacterium]
MKKKFLLILALMFVMVLSVIGIAACTEESQEIHTVTFNLSYDGATPFRVSVVDGERVERFTPAREGFVFANWYTEATHETVFVFTTPITADRALFARWTPADTHTCPEPDEIHIVTFNLGFGTPVLVSVADAETAPNFTPAREGFVFVNWYTEAAHETVFIFTTPITANRTLFARWMPVDGHTCPEPDEIFTVTFNFGVENIPPALVSVVDGNMVARPFDPSREGYEFTNWYNGATPFVFTTPITANITLTAGWTATQSFDVEFVLNNGDAPIIEEVRDGLNVAIPQNISRTGHSFVGWFLDAEATVAFNLNTIIVGNITVYAAWSRDTFEITYGENYQDITFGEDFTLSAPARPDAPHWDDFPEMSDWEIAYAEWNTNYGFGIEFFGWFYDGIRLTDENGESLSAWNIDDDVTLVAVWTEDYSTALLSFTRDGENYVVSSGTVANTVTEIIIPRTHNRRHVVAVANNAFQGLEYLENIVLPSTIVTIGSYAFEGTALVTIRLGANIETVGERALANIETLEAVFVDRAVRINDTTSLTTMAGADLFYGSDNLHVIMFRTFPAMNWTRTQANWSAYASRMHFSHFTNFNNNSDNNPANLVPIVPTYHALLFTPIWEGRVMDGEDVIEEGTIVAYSVALREEYRHLRNIIVPRVYNLRPVAHIANEGFRHGSFVEIRRNIGRSITLLQDLMIFDTITHIGNHAFANNNNLETVNLQGNAEHFGTYAFAFNRNLRTVSFSGGDAPTVAARVSVIPQRMFWENRNLENITGGIPASVQEIGVEAFGNNLSLNNPTFAAGLLHIRDGAFDNARRLDITGALPNTLQTIGNNAFRNTVSWGAGLAGNARTVNLPAIQTIGNNAFENSMIQTINITSSALTAIGNNAFQGMRRLNSITIPSTLTTLGNGAFIDTTSLSTITLPTALTAIPNQLFQRSGIASLTIPNNVTSIGNFAFNAMPNIASIVIPNSVLTIGTNAFQAIPNLTSIAIPSSVTSIGNDAFRDLPNLRTVDFSNATSLISIGNGAFHTTPLWRENVVLPSSLGGTTVAQANAAIGSAAFQASGIFSIVIPGGVGVIQANTFNGTPNLQWVQLLRWNPNDALPHQDRVTRLAALTAFTGNTTARVYVPAGSLAVYRTAGLAGGNTVSVWNNFADARMGDTIPTPPVIPPLP